MTNSTGNLGASYAEAFGGSPQATALAVLPEPPAGRSYDSRTNKAVTTAFDFFTPGTQSELLRQWHLTRLGDIASVWRDYTGAGVSVGVYDSGTQSAHWDLRYDASKHVTVGGTTLDGNEANGSGPHGTAVAGLIAAVQNGRGGVGVAHGASVTGVNIFDPQSIAFINSATPTGFFDAMAQGNRFDVINHSWGNGTTSLTTANSRAGGFAKAVADSAQFIAQTGRDGLGTITVASAGNSGIDGQVDGAKSARHTIAVGAYRQEDGVASNYSSHGAHLLISSPSNDFRDIGGTGLTTTDLLGAAGYNMFADPQTPADYTDNFGGTSGAAPIVSGVVSLMLDANEGLGWRDVRNILAASAKMPVAFETGQVLYDLVSGGTLSRLRMNEGTFKLGGDAGQWNGGAMHFSQDYGYGAVDAYNAVRMAEVWSLFRSAQTSANEASITTGVLPVNVTGSSDVIVQNVGNLGLMGGLISDAGTGRFSFTVGNSIELEHVDLTISISTMTDVYNNGVLTQTAATNLFNGQFKLTAPDGTEGFFSIRGAAALGAAEQTYVLGFAGLRGVETRGEWTVEFTALDNVTGTTRFDPKLTLNSLKMDAYGAAASNNDVHTYTDEFFTMAAISGESGRRVLSDTNGGEDWINAAAVRRNVEVSLVEGAATKFGGVNAFTIARNSRIENVVTGDGNDRLIGNALDNKLFGMRGNDWLNGGAGDDTLYGGQGNDVFAFDTAGVSGYDRILDWSAGDRIATSKQLRGADQNGLLTVGSNALLLLDGTTRGDTAELVDQGGAVLRAMGKSDGYWWYSFVSGGNVDAVDGRVRELALGQTGAAANDTLVSAHVDGGLAGTHGPALQDAAFFLYDTMGDLMSSGVQLTA